MLKIYIPNPMPSVSWPFSFVNPYHPEDLLTLIYYCSGIATNHISQLSNVIPAIGVKSAVTQ